MKPNSSFNPSRHLCSGLFAALIFSAGVFEASADNNESVLTANVFDQVQYHIFAFVIGLMAAILLVRTFTGKDNSRYLIHIAIAFGIISLSHLISTGISLMQLFTSVPADQIRRLVFCPVAALPHSKRSSRDFCWNDCRSRCFRCVGHADPGTRR
jgi:peptidoglycan/LPS O-acetylase OafA/YrhL